MANAQSICDQILGKGSSRIHPHMVEDFFVPSSYSYITIWQANTPIWNGIVDLDLDQHRIDKLKTILPNAEFRHAAIELGIHY